MHCVESCSFSNVSTGISFAIFRVNVFGIGSPYTELVVDAESDLCERKTYSSGEAKQKQV
jgi:hypothetical protein